MNVEIPSVPKWRRATAIGAVLLVALPLLSVAMAGAQPPAAQSEFVPISELPPGDQLPAARLLIGAYAFVWVVLLAYVWSIWTRLGSVRREIVRLEHRLPGEESSPR